MILVIECRLASKVSAQKNYWSQSSSFPKGPKVLPISRMKSAHRCFVARSQRVHEIEVELTFPCSAQKRKTNMSSHFLLRDARRRSRVCRERMGEAHRQILSILEGSQSHVDLIPGFGTLSNDYTSHRHVDLLRVLVSRQEQQTCATDHVAFGLSFRREVRSRTECVDKYTNLSAMKPGA
jgi:hypothetical protein